MPVGRTALLSLRGRQLPLNDSPVPPQGIKTLEMNPWLGLPLRTYIHPGMR